MCLLDYEPTRGFVRLPGRNWVAKPFVQRGRGKGRYCTNVLLYGMVPDCANLLLFGMVPEGCNNIRPTSAAAGLVAAAAPPPPPTAAAAAAAAAATPLAAAAAAVAVRTAETAVPA